MIIDSHIHSNFSSDSKQSLDEICKEAMEKGLFGFAATDHLNARELKETDVLLLLEQRQSEILSLRESYRGKLKILSGIECGEFSEAKANCEKILSAPWIDVILGSVHAVAPNFPRFTRCGISDSFSDEDIISLLKLYYRTMETLPKEMDFDVLAHITLPFRFLNRRYKRKISWRVCETEIFRILESMIKKDLALEINSDGWEDENGYHPLPDKDLASIYFQMGGRKITLGSDSHKPGLLANRFEDCIKMLKEIGFSSYYYYEKRVPVQVSFQP